MSVFFDTVLSAQMLSELLAEAGPRRRVLVLDSSFDLMDPAAGRQAYEQAHISGAHFIDVEQLLSARAEKGKGRHPLPDAEALTDHLAKLGAEDDTQIVVYDRSGGMFAARAWWLFQWLGHRAAAVLDGGFEAWQAQGLPVDQQVPGQPVRGVFSRRAPTMPTVTREEVLTHVLSGTAVVIDARSPDRFRGENETIDPVAGHIPGAINRFFKDNLDDQGRFKSPAQLASEFSALLADDRPVICQCGSGITACHNLLAMTVAGLPGAALYPGSWSEWCVHADMPVAVGSG